MNSEENKAGICEHARIHFVTDYSAYFDEQLASRPTERFEPMDISKKLRLVNVCSVHKEFM